MEPERIELTSEFEIHEFSMFWTIKNATALVINEDKRITYTSDYFDTNETCAMTEKKLRWQLSFTNNPEPLSLFSSCSLKIELDPETFSDQPEGFGFNVLIRTSLLNYKDNSEIYKLKPEACVVPINKSKPYVYFKRFVDKLHLERHIIDDSIKIKVEMLYSNCCLINYSFEKETHDTSFPQISHENQLSSDLSSLLLSGDFSDLTIQTLTGDIKAHKTILAARSPVFNSMLKSPMVENMESRIEIPDFSFEIVREMLNFIYTGIISLEDKSIETLSELFKISHKYQLDELRKNCSEVMGSKLDLDNAGEIFSISNLYEEDILKTKALLFIQTNIKNLVANEEFKNLKNSHPHIMADILFALNND